MSGKKMGLIFFVLALLIFGGIYAQKQYKSGSDKTLDMSAIKTQEEASLDNITTPTPVSMETIKPTVSPTPTPTARPIVVATPTPTPKPTPTPTPAGPKSYSLAEVAKHGNASSCWSAVNGKVYNLTSWIGQHPGGEAAILSICGKDGSSAFNDQHGGDRRPANELAGFEIGTFIN